MDGRTNEAGESQERRIEDDPPDRRRYCGGIRRKADAFRRMLLYARRAVLESDGAMIVELQDGELCPAVGEIGGPAGGPILVPLCSERRGAYVCRERTVYRPCSLGKAGR